MAREGWLWGSGKIHGRKTLWQNTKTSARRKLNRRRGRSTESRRRAVLLCAGNGTF